MRLPDTRLGDDGTENRPCTPDNSIGCYDDPGREGIVTDPITCDAFCEVQKRDAKIKDFLTTQATKFVFKQILKPLIGADPGGALVNTFTPSKLADGTLCGNQPNHPLVCVPWYRISLLHQLHYHVQLTTR
jgi:hypothetical protein